MNFVALFIHTHTYTDTHTYRSTEMATTIHTLAICAHRKRIWQHLPTVAILMIVALEAPKSRTRGAKENVNSSENTKMMSEIFGGEERKGICSIQSKSLTKGSKENIFLKKQENYVGEDGGGDLGDEYYG